MGALVWRLVAYALVVFGVRHVWAPLRRHYGPRLALAFRVSAVLLVGWALLRVLYQPHTDQEWLVAAVAVGAMGALYGVVWLVTRWLARSRRR